MTERKKLKLQNQAKECRELLEKIRNTNKEPLDENTYEILEEAKESCLNLLKDKNIRVDALNTIAELFQIREFHLEKSQIYIILSALNDILRFEITDLNLFVNSGILKKLNEDSFITKYLESFLKSSLNKETIKEIVCILIENSKNPEEHLDIILSKYEKYRNLVPRLAKLIDFNKISEDLYIQMYLDCQYVRDCVEIRMVKGKKRLAFIEKAIELNFEFVLNNYIKDRESKIRLLIAKKLTTENQKYFNIMLNDPNEEIRCALLSNLTWEMTTQAVADRLLDKFSKVREICYEIYKKGLIFLQQIPSLRIFDEAVYRQSMFNGKLSFNEKQEISVEEQEKSLEVFESFVSKLTEGCRTGMSQEYLQILKDSNFSLDFICDHVHLPGMSLFMETIKITDLDAVPIYQKPTILKYMYSGTLKSSQIQECISTNIFEVLRFISDPKPFVDQLIEKCFEIKDILTVEIIVQFLKPVLANRSPIYMPSTEEVNTSGIFHVSSANPKNFNSPNLYLLNAHTKTSELFNEQQVNGKDYPHLYFQVYKFKGDQRVVQNIKDSDISLDQLIRLLIYLNDPAIIKEFASEIICNEIDFELTRQLLNSKTVTGTLIYFLCTGLVSVTKPSFFIKAITSCLKIKKENEIKLIFEKYMKSLLPKDYNIFYTICWKLKEYSVTNGSDFQKVSEVVETAVDESLIMNPLISENISRKIDENVPVITESKFTHLQTTVLNELNKNFTDEKHDSVNLIQINEIQVKSEMEMGKDNETDIKKHNNENTANFSSKKENNYKLKLSSEDKMLHFICNHIISTRQGEILKIEFDPLKYGFFKMTDLMYEMIGHGQVLYQ